MIRRLAAGLFAFVVTLSAAEHFDDPGKLLPADVAWAKAVNAKLDAFERTAGINILVQIHLKSPSAEEDKVPGAYMSALSRKLGTLQHGVLVVYFADDPDWRVWVGDGLAVTFAGKPGTVQELTQSGSIHDVKEAMLTAAKAKADAVSAGKSPAEKLALQTDALLDALIARLTPKAAAETVINIWPEGVPGLHADAKAENDDGQGHYTNIHYPTLVVFAPPAGTANGTVIIYPPGGGYTRVSSGPNGGIIVKWLNSIGITVYMLKYRHDIYPHPAPLQDVLRAVRILRSRAAELGIKHLGMLGGSAGGHLTASAGTLYDAPEGRTGAELDKVSGRPDFMILIFPMITMRDVPNDGRRNPLLGVNPTEELKHHLSVDEQVTKDTPPAFMVHSAEDRALVEGSVLFATAMRRAGAPVELHLYAKGPHGDGMSEKFGPISEWPRLCEKWMRFNGWLPAVNPANPPAK